MLWCGISHPGEVGTSNKHYRTDPGRRVMTPNPNPNPKAGWCGLESGWVPWLWVDGM